MMTPVQFAGVYNVEITRADGGQVEPRHYEDLRFMIQREERVLSSTLKDDEVQDNFESSQYWLEDDENGPDYSSYSKAFHNLSEWKLLSELSDNKAFRFLMNPVTRRLERKIHALKQEYVAKAQPRRYEIELQDDRVSAYRQLN